MITNQFFIDNNQDNEELDAETRKIVQERDRERLRKMTFYCFTNECLRDYILRYFGEYESNYCGNCNNCRTQFEEIDVTDIAGNLIGCIKSSRQRYGVNVIIDTVHGAQSAKIKKYRMDDNPYYCTLSKVPTYKLRQIMQHLILKEYLMLTNDEYAVVKLEPKAWGILNRTETILMKMAKEQIRTSRAEKAGKSGKTAALQELQQADEELFQELRSLRLEIARKEGVPPYVVFSDKTLVQMAIIKPKNRQEMLGVSGVGHVKFDRYGVRFLECVRRMG